MRRMNIPDGLYDFRANVEGGWGIGKILIEGESAKYLIRWTLSPAGQPLPLKWLAIDQKLLTPSQLPSLYAFEYSDPILLEGAVDREQSITPIDLP